MEKEEVHVFYADAYRFSFLATGFQCDTARDGVDVDFCTYDNVEGVRHVPGDDDVIIVLRGGQKWTFRCETCIQAGQLADLFVAHARKWFDRVEKRARHEEENARYTEEREFRAKVLEKVGDVLDRIMFEPGVGYEGLEIVDKCNKRRREEEGDNK